MANYSGKDLVISFDNSGGTPQTMTNYIRTIQIGDLEASFERSEAFGDQYAENLFAGLRMLGPIVLGGYYDDTATTGPNAIFNDVGNTTAGTTRTLTITYGASKSTAVECWIQKYSRSAGPGKLTEFSVTLLPTGTITES